MEFPASGYIGELNIKISPEKSIQILVLARQLIEFRRLHSVHDQFKSVRINSNLNAGVAKLVYAQDLGSCGRRPCGFKSLPRHLGSVVQLWQRRQIQDLEVVGSNPIGATGRYCMSRRSVCFVVAAFVISVSSNVYAQQDQCAGITCAGHGRCVVIRGEPGCACDEGFTADATGLNCASTVPPPVAAPVEVTSAPEPAPAPEATPAPAPATVTQPAPARRDRMLTIRLGAPFLSDRERPYLNCRIAGLSYEVAGLPLVLLAVINDLAGEPDIGAFLEYPVSDTMLGIGVALVVTGAILSLVGFFGQRKIRRAVLAGQTSRNILWTRWLF